MDIWFQIQSAQETVMRYNLIDGLGMPSGRKD